jgi:RNA polymerase sigma factor (sigma-70 family)
MEQREERQERFRALYLETRAQVLAYALRRTNSVDDAADVVAETFAIAWRRLDDVPKGGDALPWLYVTARNAISNESRRARRRSKLVERVGSVLAAREVFVAPTDEAALTAVQAIQALDAGDREVLLLTAWEGLDDEAAGRVLGCSSGAARVRLHRARKKLEEQLAARSVAGDPEKHRVPDGHTKGEGAATGRTRGKA